MPLFEGFSKGWAKFKKEAGEFVDQAINTVQTKDDDRNKNSSHVEEQQIPISHDQASPQDNNAVDDKLVKADSLAAESAKKNKVAERKEANLAKFNRLYPAKAANDIVVTNEFTLPPLPIEITPPPVKEKISKESLIRDQADIILKMQHVAVKNNEHQLNQLLLAKAKKDEEKLKKIDAPIPPLVTVEDLNVAKPVVAEVKPEAAKLNEKKPSLLSRHTKKVAAISILFALAMAGVFFIPALPIFATVAAFIQTYIAMTASFTLLMTLTGAVGVVSSLLAAGVGVGVGALVGLVADKISASKTPVKVKMQKVDNSSKQVLSKVGVGVVDKTKTEVVEKAPMITAKTERAVKGGMFDKVAEAENPASLKMIDLNKNSR